jgi:hypothetical protein
MIFNNRVKYALVIYLAFVILLVLSKPKFFFQKDGNFKAFGTGAGKTPIPFWLVLLVAVIISYYLANLFILIRV